jgi:hypothetical protein
LSGQDDQLDVPDVQVEAGGLPKRLRSRVRGIYDFFGQHHGEDHETSAKSEKDFLRDSKNIQTLKIHTEKTF